MVRIELQMVSHSLGGKEVCVKVLALNQSNIIKLQEHIYRAVSAKFLELGYEQCTDCGEWYTGKLFERQTDVVYCFKCMVKYGERSPYIEEEQS